MARVGTALAGRGGGSCDRKPEAGRGAVRTCSVEAGAGESASYPDEQGQERFVSFEGSSDALMVDNKRLVGIKYFHMDCSYDGMVRLFNLGNGFKVEQTNGTFVINPV